MKICICSTFFTGATLPLQKHLQERGNQVDFYLFAHQGATGLETLTLTEPVEGCAIIEVSKNNHIFNYLDIRSGLSVVPYYLVKNRKFLIGFVSYFKNICIIRHLIQRIEKEQYDLIYLIVNEEHDAILCRELKRRGLKNIIVAYHEVVKSHTQKETLKDCVEATVGLGYPVICYSNKTREQLYRLTGIENLHTIYFGPFETYRLFDTSQPMIKEKYILFIGGIQPYKGLPFLYNSIQEYGNRLDCKMVVAGCGYDSVLEEMKKDNRYMVINRFLSDIEFANLTLYASCIVCPYVSGSQSGITHTAMVYGTPVVATTVGAFPEFIEEGKNGFLVKYGDRQGLMDAIYQTLNSKMHETYIPTHLNWDNIAKQTENLKWQE